MKDIENVLEEGRIIYNSVDIAIGVELSPNHVKKKIRENLEGFKEVSDFEIKSVSYQGTKSIDENGQDKMCYLLDGFQLLYLFTVLRSTDIVKKQNARTVNLIRSLAEGNLALVNKQALAIETSSEKVIALETRVKQLEHTMSLRNGIAIKELSHRLAVEDNICITTHNLRSFLISQGFIMKDPAESGYMPHPKYAGMYMTYFQGSRGPDHQLRFVHDGVVYLTEQIKTAIGSDYIEASFFKE